MILQIIVGIMGIVSLWLRDYYSQGAKDKREVSHGQEGRKEILAGDTAAVESRVDRVCSQAGSSDAGSKSDEAIARELSTIYGVAVNGYSSNKDTGTSGKMPE